MAEQFKTNVKLTDIDLSDPHNVSLRSPGLVNTLVHSTPHALEKLANEIGPVPIDSVSIDDAGRIVISDKDFRAKIEERISSLGPKATAADTNYVCSNAYQCTK